MPAFSCGQTEHWLSQAVVENLSSSIVNLLLNTPSCVIVSGGVFALMLDGLLQSTTSSSSPFTGQATISTSGSMVMKDVADKS
jgi:hypothetical protein